MKYTYLILPALCGVTLSAQCKADSRPNILFCIADDASKWTFGAYGGTFAKTPAIDALAEQGAKFENAFTENPKSAPSRACLVTGKHSWQLKEATDHFCHFPAEFKFYPHIMMENGYEVGYTGKGWGPGVYDTEHNPAGPEYNELVCEVPAKGIRSVDYSGNFKAFLKQKEKKKPFCFWLGAYEPHRFYEKDSWKRDKSKSLDQVTPQPFFPDNEIVRGDMLDYAVEVEWYDRHIGEAVEALRQSGELDNTIIIITSDHGMPFPRIKAQMYDEGFHVPFIVYWKGVVKAGSTIQDFIGFQDVAPTIMEAAGLEPDSQMSGRSFLDVLKGESDASRDHILLCKERHDVGRASEEGINLGYPVRCIRTAEYLYVHNYASDRWPAGNPEYGFKNCDASPSKEYLTSLKPADEDYKYYQMAFGMRPEEQLFNVKRDPHCMNNLAYQESYREIKTKLREQMEQELTDLDDPRMFGNGDVFDTYPYMGKQCDYSNPYGFKSNPKIEK